MYKSYQAQKSYLSFLLRTCISYFLFPQILDLARYTSSPMPPWICFINIFMKNVITIQVGLFFNGIFIFKYFCIFILKNPTGMQDEFWSLFIWRWVLAFSFISQSVVDFFPGQYSMNYLICIGKENVVSKSHGTKILRNNVMLFVAVFSLINCISLCLRIKMFQMGIDKHFVKNMTIFFSQKRILESLEKHSITDYLTSLYFVVYLCISLSILYTANIIDKTKVNYYPFYFYIYILQLALPLFFCFSIGLLYYVRHQSLRRIIFRELKIIFSLLFWKAESSRVSKSQLQWPKTLKSY